MTSTAYLTSVQPCLEQQNQARQWRPA